MTHLKKCPKHKITPDIKLISKIDDSELWAIFCLGCDSIMLRSTKQAVIEAWNTRGKEDKDESRS